MGFTVVHQPSYALVGAFAAEAAKKQRQIELAKEWAELFLRKRQVDLQARQLNQQALFQAAQLQQAQQRAMLDAWLQQQRLGLDWFNAEAARAHDLALARMREEAAARRQAEALAHDKGMATVRHMGDIALEEARARHAKELEEARARNAMALEELRRGAGLTALGEEILAKAEGDATEVLTGVSALRLNEAGLAKREEVRAEYERIMRDATLTGRAKAEALRMWIAKASELTNPIYRDEPPTLDEKFKKEVLEVNGSYYQRKPDGTWEQLNPRSQTTAGRNEDGSPKFYYHPTEEQWYYLDNTGRIQFVGITKSQFISEMLKKESLGIVRPQTVQEIVQAWKHIAPSPDMPPGAGGVAGGAGATPPAGQPAAPPPEEREPTINGIPIPKDFSPDDKLTAVGGPFVYAQLQAEDAIRGVGGDLRKYMENHYPRATQRFMEVEDKAAPEGYSKTKLIPHWINRKYIYPKKIKNRFNLVSSTVWYFDDNRAMGIEIEADLEKMVAKKDRVGLALLESSVADSLWRLQHILAPGRSDLDILADLYDYGWIEKDPRKEEIIHVERNAIIQARAAQNMLMGYLVKIRKAQEKLQAEAAR